MRIVYLLAASGAALMIATSVASAAPSSGLVEAAGSTFPDRSYVLTLPTKRSLTPSTVHVTENGHPVQGVSIVSQQAAAQPHFATVLLIDASNSMRGKPITAAMAAVRAFEAHRSPGQSLAVIAFDGAVRVVLPFTSDAGQISAALLQPPSLGNGTKIYDALDRARGLLEEAKVASGSIVLLSDGVDVGSVAKPAPVLQNLAAGHLRVFSVGLKSPTYDANALANVAAATGGSYVKAATPSALAGIYDSLGETLSNQYLISYHSLEGPGKQVAVRVAVDGVPGAAVSAYSTPALRIVAAPPYRPSQVSKVVESPLTGAIVAILICLLLGWGVVMIVSRRSDTLPSRVGQFVGAADSSGHGKRKLTVAEEQAAAQFLNRRKRPFEQHRLWQQLQTALSVADIDMSAARLVALTTFATLLAVVVFSLALGNWGILLGLTVPFIVRGVVRGKMASRRRAFADQLPENLDVLASSLRAGHSLVGGLAVVVENTPEPSKSELQRVLAEERLGMSLDDALRVVVDRMDNRDVDQVAFVVRLQREMGSNSAEVLDRVVETVRARTELRRLVQTLTAQGRFSRWVLTAIPLFLALALTLINRNYLAPLFDNTGGRVMLVVAALMTVVGSRAIGKIVDIKV
jgi:tight adherence protein B